MKRELLISFAGHIILVGIIAFITQNVKKSETATRPAVITVEILRGITPGEENLPSTAHLFEQIPKPTPIKKEGEKPKSKLEPKGTDAMIKRAGLGAKVEGVAALGYNFYIQQMLERIAENWQDPQSNRTKKITATVMFVIERDGSLREIKLERGSGDAIFDESCLRAIMVTRKLPPLPEEFTAPRLKIHLEFEG
ncbi:MAG: energy transducer TonB [candidate division WOR-3 bacterium]